MRPCDTETADIAVIGAGAAGLLAAIMAGRADAKRKLRIVLFDTRAKVGAKILISGGTRCNVTNFRVTTSDYEGAPSHLVKHVLEAFTPDKTRQFFEEIGVPLLLEPTGKYFPTTHSGRTVLEALLKELKRLEIPLIAGERITEARKEGDTFQLGPYKMKARRVILATGGLSYPETGSDGTGYRIAESLGHTRLETVPALTPLTTADEDWQSLTGLALETKLSFFKSGRKEAERKGAFLFTHFGFSGPAALDISRFIAAASKKEEPAILANFLPAETVESLNAAFSKVSAKHPEKRIKTFFSEELELPARFVEIFFKKTSVDGEVTLRRTSSRDRNKLFHTLLHYPLEITGVVGYKKAEVTAGGIDLREIKTATMESKLAPGLYFAGEILDVDGRIGGFNFQWAWSSGSVAGRSAARSALA